MSKKIYILFGSLLLIPIFAFAQTDTTVEDDETIIDETPLEDEVTIDVTDEVVVVDTDEEVFDTDFEEELDADEDVSAEELGIEDPNLLPDSPFYFLKNIGRGIRSTFTFDETKKAHLRIQFAKEKILEAKKIAERTGNTARVEQALENFEQEVGRIDTILSSIDPNNRNIDRILDSFTDAQIKAHRLMGRIESASEDGSLTTIARVRNRIANSLSEVPLRFDSPEQFKDRLEQAFDQQSGSQFREFKHLEILKDVESRVPDRAKQAIQAVRERSQERLENRLSRASDGVAQKFERYLEHVGGDAEKHEEILNDFRSDRLPSHVRQRIQTVKDKVQIRIEEQRLRFDEGRPIHSKAQTHDGFLRNASGTDQDFDPSIPQIRERLKEIDFPRPDFDEQRNKFPRDDAPEKPDVTLCTAEYNPVCGSDGRTYSNACNARVNGVPEFKLGACNADRLDDATRKPVPTTTPPKRQIINSINDEIQERFDTRRDHAKEPDASLAGYLANLIRKSFDLSLQ